MGNPAGAARRIRGGGGWGGNEARGACDPPRIRRAFRAARPTDGSFWFLGFLDEKMPSVRRTTLIAGPGRQTGRMGAMVRKILSEAPDHVEGEAIGEEALGVYDSGFVAEAEVEVGADSGAEAAAEGDGSVCGSAAEVDEVVAFAIEREGGAIADDGGAVHGDEGDEPLADVVVGHETVVEAGGFGVAVDGETEADVGGEVEVAEALGGGDEEIEFAVAVALEDLFLAEGSFEGDAWGEDELVGAVVDEGVFEAEADVGPAGSAGACAWVDVDVAVFGGDEGEAVGDGPAELEGVEVDVAAFGDEAVVDVVAHVDRPEFRADRGVFEEDGVIDWGDGVGEPVAGGWGRGWREGWDGGASEGCGGGEGGRGGCGEDG